MVDWQTWQRSPAAVPFVPGVRAQMGELTGVVATIGEWRILRLDADCPALYGEFCVLDATATLRAAYKPPLVKG